MRQGRDKRLHSALQLIPRKSYKNLFCLSVIALRLFPRKSNVLSVSYYSVTTISQKVKRFVGLPVIDLDNDLVIVSYLSYNTTYLIYTP